MTQIVIGTRIYSILYGGRNGVVYAIHGEQAPGTVQSLGGGICMMGGRAEFDIVFENGTESKRLPECILRGVQWRVYDEIATTEEIRAMRDFAVKTDLKQRNDEAIAKMKFADAVAAYRVDPRYSKLRQVPNSSYGGGVFVAANIRIELKAAFPGIKFGVRSDYNSVNINWLDGPTTKEVEAITTKYSGGYFDGMDDSYNYVRSPFTEVYGSAQYIFENRHYTKATMQAAADIVSKRFGCEPFKVEAFNDGQAYINCNSHNLQSEVYAFLEQRYPYEKAA
jgi:hypothetical protein